MKGLTLPLKHPLTGPLHSHFYGDLGIPLVISVLRKKT